MKPKRVRKTKKEINLPMKSKRVRKINKKEINLPITQRLQEDELVLMDAGCEFHGELQVSNVMLKMADGRQFLKAA